VSASPAVFTAARHHHGLGRNITPVEGKRPTFTNWTTRRASLEEIETELAGRATGLGFVGGVSNSNIVPLDFDSEVGEAWWRSQCEAAGGDPDDWPTAITPGKKPKNGGQRRAGRHRYVHDVRGTLTNAAGRLKDLGIDVRGRGLVVMPPSPHPDGGIYEWVRNHTLDDFPDGIPPCPPFIYDAIIADRDDGKGSGDGSNCKARSGSSSGNARIVAYCKAAFARTSAELATAAAGSRNTALNTSALKLGRLAHYGIFTEAEARAALHGACIANGLIRDDGEQAFATTFSSGWTKGTADPRDIPEDERRQRRSTQDGSNGTLTGCDGTVLRMEDFVAYSDTIGLGGTQVTAPHDPRGWPHPSGSRYGCRRSERPYVSASASASFTPEGPQIAIGAARRGFARGLRPHRCPSPRNRRPPSPAAGVVAISRYRRFT
jgi:hypothetical protein